MVTAPTADWQPFYQVAYSIWCFSLSASEYIKVYGSIGCTWAIMEEVTVNCITLMKSAAISGHCIPLRTHHTLPACVNKGHQCPPSSNNGAKGKVKTKSISQAGTVSQRISRDIRHSAGLIVVSSIKSIQNRIVNLIEIVDFFQSLNNLTINSPSELGPPYRV